MDIEALMKKQGMRDFTDEQRDTLVNDAVQIRQLAQIIQARLAKTEINGDRTGAAPRRARKVTRQFEKVAKLLEKAAAGCEGINATYVHEVIELPDRRKKALAKKKERQQTRALTRAKAQEITAQTLSQSAQHLLADPRTAQPQMPATAAPQPQYVHPHAYTAQQTHQAPLADFSSVFEETG